MQDQLTITVPATKCTKCGQLRPVSDFLVDRRRGTPVARCRFCAAEHQRASKPPKSREPVPAAHKRCSHCQAIKPLDQFSRESAKKDGLRGTCKGCDRLWTKQWEDANKARVAARNAAKVALNPPTPPDTKECSRCGQNKSLDRFRLDLRYRQGVTGWCRDCRREQAKEYDARRACAPKIIPDSFTCITCGSRKPSGEFSKCSRTAEGIRHRCKDCRHKYEWKGQPEDERLRRKAESYLWTLYRIRPEEFAGMLAAQDGLCGICQRKMVKPCVDHSHETGKIRALLCVGCNTRVGTLEDKEFLDKASRYLSRFPHS